MESSCPPERLNSRDNISPALAHYPADFAVRRLVDICNLRTAGLWVTESGHRSSLVAVSEFYRKQISISTEDSKDISCHGFFLDWGVLIPDRLSTCAAAMCQRRSLVAIEREVYMAEARSYELPMWL